jgi:hypothetical protein
VTHQACCANSVTITIAPTFSPAATWTLSSIYGPVLEELKPAFLDELRDMCAQATGPLLLCGNFNQIYHAANKNNNRLTYARCGASIGCSTTHSSRNSTCTVDCTRGLAKGIDQRLIVSIGHLQSLTSLRPSQAIIYAACLRTARTTRLYYSSCALSHG